MSFLDANDAYITSVKISLSNPNKFDSFFSPAAAFFAGIGSLFTAIVLYKQIGMANYRKRNQLKQFFMSNLI